MTEMLIAGVVLGVYGLAFGWVGRSTAGGARSDVADMRRRMMIGEMPAVAANESPSRLGEALTEPTSAAPSTAMATELSMNPYGRFISQSRPPCRAHL